MSEVEESRFGTRSTVLLSNGPETPTGTTYGCVPKAQDDKSESLSVLDISWQD
jgi:hypothetical protein